MFLIHSSILFFSSWLSALIYASTSSSSLCLFFKCLEIFAYDFGQYMQLNFLSYLRSFLLFVVGIVALIVYFDLK